MSCARIAFPLVAATVLTVTGLRAEDRAPVPSPGESATVPTLPAAVEVTTPASPELVKPTPRPRAISPAAAAQLAVAAPKYEPPPPAPTGETSPDLREIDRPRNTIIRLPNYLVQEEKVIVPTEREVMTPQARLSLALKKYPGLRLGSFWIFRNDGIALAMLAEEERLEQKRAFEDLVQLMQVSDPAAKATAKRSVEQAFMREADFGR